MRCSAWPSHCGCNPRVPRAGSLSSLGHIELADIYEADTRRLAGYLRPDGSRVADGMRELAAGFKQVSSFNPYWETRGRTYEDPDGYRALRLT